MSFYKMFEPKCSFLFLYFRRYLQFLTAQALFSFSSPPSSQFSQVVFISLLRLFPSLPRDLFPPL